MGGDTKNTIKGVPVRYWYTRKNKCSNDDCKNKPIVKLIHHDKTKTRYCQEHYDEDFIDRECVKQVCCSMRFMEKL